MTASHSALEGIATETTTATVVMDRRLPERIRALIDAGGRILLCSRWSADAGEVARRQAVQGVFTAARALREQGCDVTELLPSKSELTLRLQTLAITRRNLNRRTAQPFTNHSYLYDQRAAEGLLVLVQYGTGVALDDRFQQPAVELVREAVATHQPVLLFANEVRAWGRTGFALGPLVFQLQDVSDRLGEPVYLGDVEHPVRPLSDTVERELFEEGKRGEAEAAKTARRTRAGMREKTATGQVTGPFPFGLPNALPPPLATARLRAGGGPGAQVAFLDTPGSRPAPEDILYGPAVVVPGSRDQPVDQLALVRWFYQHYLTDGWTVTATADYLAAHGFSTVGSRRARGSASSTVRVRQGRDHGGDASRVCQGILAHREFHVTGRLVQHIIRGQPVDLLVLTPDGEPMATVGQDRRIRVAETQTRSLRSRNRVHLFTGQPVTLNGEDTVLAPSVRRDVLQYTFNRAHPVIPGQRRRVPAVALPHRVIAEAIVSTLAAEESALLPLPIDQARRARALATQQAASLDLTDATRALGKARAHIRKPELEASGLAEAQAALDDAIRRHHDVQAAAARAAAVLRDVDQPSDPSGLPVSDTFAFVAALLDARDDRLRVPLRLAIGDFAGTSTRTRVIGGLSQGELRFEFTLRLRADDGRTWQARVHGHHQQALYHYRTGGRRGAPSISDGIHRALTGMHAGIPLRETLGADYRAWQPYLRVALGLDANTPCVLANVRDPRLLSLGMAVLHPMLPGPPPPFTGVTPAGMPLLVGPPLSSAQLRGLARRTGEPVALLRRLAEVYGHPTARIGTWLRCRSPALAAAIAAGGMRSGISPTDVPVPRTSQHDGRPVFEMVRGRIRTRGCPHCGSRRRARPLLREAEGLVCLRCRRDDGGSRWPADPYDKYLDQGVETSVGQHEGPRERRGGGSPEG